MLGGMRHIHGEAASGSSPPVQGDEKIFSASAVIQLYHSSIVLGFKTIVIDIETVGTYTNPLDTAAT